MKKIWEVQRLFRQRESNDKVDKWIDSQKEDSEKNMSLNFAITLTIAITTVLYKSYVYFQNNALNEHQVIIFIFLSSVSIAILALVLIFILLRGLSIELDESTLKSNISILSSKFYKTAFLIFIIWTITFSMMLINYSSNNQKSGVEYIIALLYLFVIYYICRKLGYNFDFQLTLKHEIAYFFLIAALLLFINLYISFDVKEVIIFLAIVPVSDITVSISESLTKRGISSKSTSSKELSPFVRHLSVSMKMLNSFSGLLRVMYFSIFLLLIVSYIVGAVFTFQNHINLEMADTYDENESLIHASLKLTGYNENITLTVSKIDSTNEINKVETLVLKPTSDSSYKGDILFWTYLGNGEYSIYLNMTNQPSGYYKLSTETTHIKTTAKVFYVG